MDWFAHFNKAISPALREYFQLSMGKPAQELEELLTRIEIAEQQALIKPAPRQEMQAQPRSADPPSARRAQASTPWLKAEGSDGDWLQEFGKRAGPRLRDAFGNGLDNMPDNIISRIEQLRIAEQKLLRSKLK